MQKYNYKVDFTGEDNLSPQVKKIKNELNNIADTAQKLDKIDAKFEKITNSTAPLQRKLKDLQAIMGNMKYDGLDKTDTFKKVTAEAQKLKQALEGAKNEINGIASNGSKLEGIFGKLNIGKGGGIASAIGSIGSMAAIGASAAAGVGLLTSKVADLANEGIELALQAEGIKHRFEQIGGTAVYLENLRNSTHGLVNDLDLMKATVKAKDFNIPMKDLGTYLEFAQLKAQQTGESVDYLVDSIVTGLGRQSVQILDNLGISAAELRDKMSQGKTMTEAVAEVINNQLTQAGAHFETEADKAQRKLIELQNEQMRVGENLAPLKTEWENFLTSIQIWAMKAVQVLGGLVSEAQRLKNIQNDMYGGKNGGPSLADKQIESFKKIGKGKQNASIEVVRGQYNNYINQLSGQIYNIRQQIKKERENGANPSDTYSLSVELRKLLDKQKAARAERDKAINGMRAYLKSQQNDEAKSSNIDLPTSSSGKIKPYKSPTVRTTTPKQSPKDRIIEKGTDRFETDMRKIALNDEEVKIPYTFVPTKTPEEVKAEILGFTNTYKSELQGNIDKLFAEANKVQMKFDAGEIDLDTAQQILDTISNMLHLDVPLKIDTSEVDKAKKDFDNIIDSTKLLGESMGNIGNAFKTPELEVGGIIAQAIATLVQQFAAVPKGATIWDWIAGSLAGVAVLTSTISQIKSATAGFAEGGIVGGSSYSGDKLLARVNSGEMILPAKKASELGNILQDNTRDSYSSVEWRIKGSDLYGALHNYSKVKAKSGKITGIK